MAIICKGDEVCNCTRCQKNRQLVTEQDNMPTAADEGALRRQQARIADRVDGYDRDDLGESLDF